MRWAIAALFLVMLVAPGRAQSFDLSHASKGVVELDGSWRFKPGDDARWSGAEFDDSQWALLASDKSWVDQGYKDLSGFAWYRFKLTLPAGDEAFALYLPSIRNCYEVFADGVLVKTVGTLPPHGVRYAVIPTVVPLPASPGSWTREIAIRVWRDPKSNGGGGGPIGKAFAGTTAAIEGRAEADLKSGEWNDSENFDTGLLFLLGAIITFTLYVMRPTEREFLWIALYNLAEGSVSILQGWQDTHTHAYQVGLCFSYGLQILGAVGYLLFFQELFRPPKDMFYRAAWLALTVVGTGCALFTFQIISAPVSNAIDATGIFVIFLWVGIMLVRRSRAGDVDARILCLPVLLSAAAIVFDSSVAVVSTSGKQLSPRWFNVTLSPFPVSYDSITAIVGVFIVLALLVSRLARSKQKEERYAAEMEAARVVQQVLLPEPNATLEGFEIAAEYFPAAEVGGDFYQILPTRDGGLLLVTGDVSGKGMPAAMLVALLVGAIRTEAAHTSDPAVLLETLNRRVYRRMSSGFATCGVLYVSADGEAVFANAANPAPYLNGEEMEMPGALPLGMLPEVQYDNYRFDLEPGDVLSFVSDGVVEAMKSETGELFGFERTRGLSQLPAAEIAETARSFGQNDDITVLTVARLAAVMA